MGMNASLYLNNSVTVNVRKIDNIGSSAEV